MRTQQSLSRAIRHGKPDFLIPADDLAVYEAQRLALADPAVRALYERSQGNLEAGLRVAERAFLYDLATELGIPSAESVPVGSLAEATSIAAAWGYPVVLKKDGTWGGNGVAILRSQAQLAPAFATLLRPVGLAARWKRRLVNGDRLAFADSTAGQSTLTLQRYVEGVPANAMFACSEGKVLAGMQVRVHASQGTTGAALIVDPIRDERIHQAGVKLAAALGLSGFFGLDFMLRQGSGEPLLIELNPRTTQLGHLPLADGSDLAGHMYAAWTGHSQPKPSIHPAAARIAFFPQALHNLPDPALLEGAYLDLPAEAALRHALEKPSWPEQRWMARVYHALRKPPIPGFHLHLPPDDGSPGNGSPQDGNAADADAVVQKATGSGASAQYSSPA